ncbi:hypothetical protein OSB04_029101 [Centaurea solstitialis]|uniref:Peptidase A1 domain-containing protein n=1 Tax=Centaurea solstitialis TaxID=347529 RepID=A0AA38SH26_9ASTR|nr:hypothetical protein OSB04_029101 [Centaurea solstitialis]
MASKIFLSSSILFSILFHILSVIHPSTSIPTPHKQTGFRATLTRRANFPKNRRFLNGFDAPAGARLASTLNADDDEYTMNINIGTPPVVFKAVIDTGSDLIWAKCNVNYSSSRTTSSSTISSSKTTTFSPFSPSSTVSVTKKSSSYSSHKNYLSSYGTTSSFSFNPLKSQSFSPVTEPCETFNLSEDCKMSYADNTAIGFFMGHETLTMDTTTAMSTPSVTFACGVPDGDGFGYDGIVGMGRGKLSLLSQLNERVFGYCLPTRFGGGDDESKKGVFVAGSEARSIGNNDVMQTTPLHGNSKPGYESLYYVSLEGISVGGTRLDVTRSDFELLADGSGGMVVDSGATFTSLDDRIVDMIKDEFLEQTRLKKSEVYKAPYDVLDLCFDSNEVAAIELPKIVFHFEGADWDMSRENYIYKDGSQPQSCFAIITYGDDKTSVLGNIQQQNMMVVYDLDENSLSFKPAKCNELYPSAELQIPNIDSKLNLSLAHWLISATSTGPPRIANARCGVAFLTNSAVLAMGKSVREPRLEPEPFDICCKLTSYPLPPHVSIRLDHIKSREPAWRPVSTGTLGSTSMPL